MKLASARKLVGKLKKVVEAAKDLKVVPGMEAHAVYELYVAVQAIDDMATNYDVRLVNTANLKELRFPLAPSNKFEFPYMEASTKGKRSVVKFQICLGTKYSNSTGTTFAPDLSIQVANSPLKPTAIDVVFFWDCKYYSSNRLPRDTVEGLSGKVLGAFKPAGLLVGSVFTNSDLPATNAIVTNCKASTYKPQDLTAFGVDELSSFNPGTTATRRP